MKKLILIAAVAFTACNGGSKECPTKCDSTSVDSTLVDSTKAIDTLNPRGEVDTTILKKVK